MSRLTLHFQHSIDGLVVRIFQAMLNESIALLRHSLRIEGRGARFSQQEAVQKRDCDFAPRVGLAQNVPAFVLVDGALTILLRHGNSRRRHTYTDEDKSKSLLCSRCHGVISMCWCNVERWCSNTSFSYNAMARNSLLGDNLR